MTDTSHAQNPLRWNHAAIAAAAASAGVRCLRSHLGEPLPPAPTLDAMSLLVATLPIAFAETVVSASGILMSEVAA